MKTLITLLFVLFQLTISAQGVYKTLQECKNDTLQYIAYNFEQNKTRYIGKKMQVLLDEIDIPLMTKYLLVGDTGPWAGNKVRNLSLHYFPILTTYKNIGKIVYSVHVSFDSSTYSHNIDDFDTKFRDEEGDIAPWNDQLYQFFKDYKIKDIWVRKLPMDE